MATSTLIQNLNTGYVDGFGAAVTGLTGIMNRQQFETFLAGETVAAGDVVCLDLSKTADSDKALYVVKTDSAATSKKAVVGVVVGSVQSDGALTAGSKISVCIRGIASTKVSAAVAQGSYLSVSATAGQLDDTALAVTAPFGAIALEAAGAAGTIKAFVLGLF